jgi:DNA-3-methyladenine glycosylase I
VEARRESTTLRAACFRAAAAAAGDRETPRHDASSGKDEPMSDARGQEEVVRCGWSAKDPLMVAYHDREWGAPVHDDGRHFEFLVLEAAQAGLSWSTVLRKREGYRRAFVEFDPQKVARFTPARIEKLIANPEIIRNRLKIEAAVHNAKRFLAVRDEFGSFDAYCWRFVDGAPRLNRWKTLKQVPATTRESDAFSKDLKQRGFKFVGSTVVYAHMQAVGMVNDHLTTCFRYGEVQV